MTTQAAEQPFDGFEHPGWKLSIEQLFAHRARADLGHLSDLYDVYDDLYGDDLTLAGLVDQRVDAVAGCAMTVNPGDDTAAAHRNAEDFREMWVGLDTETLMSRHQRGSLFYGFTATELIWDWRPDVRRYDVVGLVQPRARFFRVATAAVPWVEGAVPNELLVQVDRYGAQFERLIPDKWIVTRQQGYELPLQSQGLMRQCALFAVMKKEAYGDWFLFLTRFGLPFVEAQISSWTDKDAVATARKGLASMGSTRGLISAESDKVRFDVHDGAAASRTSASDVHQRFAQGCDLQFAKRWNGAALPTESAGSNSYALAKEQGGIRYGLLKGDKKRLERATQRQLVEPWMRLNGRTGAAPRVVIGLARVDDPNAVVSMAKEMHEIGARPDPGYLHEVTGIPPAKEKPHG